VRVDPAACALSADDGLWRDISACPCRTGSRRPSRAAV